MAARAHQLSASSYTFGLHLVYLIAALTLVGGTAVALVWLRGAHGSTTVPTVGTARGEGSGPALAARVEPPGEAGGREAEQRELRKCPHVLARSMRRACPRVVRDRHARAGAQFVGPGGGPPL